MQSSSRTSSSSSSGSSGGGGAGSVVRKDRLKETMEKNTKPEIGDIFYNSSSNNCLSSAPVIPTSHQYGLVLVPNDHPHGHDDTATVAATTATVVSSSLVDHQNLKGVDTLVTVMSASSAASTPATNLLSGEPLKDNQSRTTTMINNRFKVVKIETTVPFKRGRWTCMDYFDHHDSNNGSGSSSGIVGASIGNMPTKDCGNVTMMMTTMTTTTTNTGPQNTGTSAITSASSSTTSSQSSSAAISPPQTLPPPPSLAVTATISASSNHHHHHHSITAKNDCTLESSQSVTNQATITNTSGTTTTTTVPSSASSNIQILSCTSEISDDGISETSPGSMTGGGSSLASPNQKVSANGTVVVVGTHVHENDDSDDRLSENGIGTTGSGNGGMVTPVEPTTSAVSNDQNTSSATAATAAAAIDDTTTTTGESNAQNPVAIDNKIEQAMDLVKSHLMFAVREEVEVLKEKISELMDRINQLEMENVYLRGHVTSDVLAKIPIVAATQIKVVAPVAIPITSTTTSNQANGNTPVSSTSNNSGNGANSSSSSSNGSGGNGNNSSGNITTATPTTSAAMTIATTTTTTTTSNISSNITVAPIVTSTTTTTITTTTTATNTLSTNSSTSDVGNQQQQQHQQQPSS